MIRVVTRRASRGFNGFMRFFFGGAIVEEERDFWRGIAEQRWNEIIAAEREIARLKREGGQEMTTERKQKLTEIVARAWARQEVSSRLADPVLAGAIVAQLMEELPALEPNPVVTELHALNESVDRLAGAVAMREDIAVATRELSDVTEAKR